MSSNVTIPEALRLGLQHQQAGRWQQAEQIYRQILQVAPQVPDAWHLLGALALQVGKPELAVEYIGRALALTPREALFLNNLGAAQLKLGQLSAAEKSFRSAIEARPNATDARKNLGLTLQQQARHVEAIECFEEALRQQPEQAEAFYQLGHAWHTAQHPAKAIPCYQQALHRDPHHSKAHYNLGLAFQQECALEQAVVHYQQALALDAKSIEAHTNLAVAFQGLGDYEQARSHFDRALHLNPNYAEARKNRALLLLQLGEFAEGFAEYEWRWHFPDLPQRGFIPPLWDGSPLAGRTILLHAEQGLGDTLQFVRYAPLVQERGGRVIVECQPSLIPLLRGVSGIHHLVPRGSPLPEFDVHCPLLSLPRVCATTVDTIPARIPYLTASTERVRHWQSRLAGERRFRIGLAWQGNPQHHLDRLRSIPLTAFSSLMTISDIVCYSLQKGFGADQVAQIPGTWPVADLGPELDLPAVADIHPETPPAIPALETAGAFVDTAAVMKNLDLVITTDTSIVHLAGALGVPTWLLLSQSCDWRWLAQRDDTPWYPTVRLFRQPRLGDWSGVFSRVADELRSCLAKRASTAGLG